MFVILVTRTDASSMFYAVKICNCKISQHDERVVI